MNPDRLAELEEQRRFLLSSIRDIEREHDVGDVDDHDFHALRDGYVARAAAVMREIEDGRSSLPPKPTSQWWRRPALIVGTLAVALALGVFVARSAGQRLPGSVVFQVPERAVPGELIYRQDDGGGLAISLGASG